MQGFSTPNPYAGMTGGNAIKFYAQNTIKMSKSQSLTQWPYSVSKLPENSFVITYRLDKIKCDGRYKGLSLKSYFVEGEFNKRFNTICLGKEVGLHDGKKFEYPNPEKPDEMITYKNAGLNAMINGKTPLPDEAVAYMHTLILPTYNKLVTGEKAYKEEVPEDTPVEDPEKD